MPKNLTRDLEPAPPLQEGDFHRIAGIGPGIEQRLHAAGIKTFEQLAALTPIQIAERLSGLVGVKPEIIERKDWPGQARRLAQEQSEAQEARQTGWSEAAGQTGEADEPFERQYYDSYLVELLLDEDHTVRRTRISRVKDGINESWAGWDAQKLVAWLAGRSGLQAAGEAPESETPVNEILEGEAREPAGQEEVLPASLVGSLRILDVKTTCLDDEGERDGYLFEAGQPFDVTLILDLSAIEVPSQTLLYYRSTVIVRRLGSGEWVEQGFAQGEVFADDTAAVRIQVSGMPAGTYRLESLVAISRTADRHIETARLQAMSEGKLVQVI